MNMYIISNSADNGIPKLLNPILRHGFPLGSRYFGQDQDRWDLQGGFLHGPYRL